MMTEVSAKQKSDEGIVSLGTRNGMELAILKRAEKSLGKIIAKPDSADLIDGVRIEPLQIYPDDRRLRMPDRRDALGSYRRELQKQGKLS